jgi:hypothetical protein
MKQILTINPSHNLSHSPVNKNWFVKLDNEIIAGFKDKKDAQLFVKVKYGCKECESLNVYHFCGDCGQQDQT